MSTHDDAPHVETTAEEAQAVSRLRAHFAREPIQATVEGAKALFALRDPEAILAEWSQQEFAAVRSSATIDDEAALHWTDGPTQISVVPSPGRLDGRVAPIDADVVVEEIGGTTHQVDLDAAGGFTVPVTGLVRLRLRRPEEPDVLSDVISVPG
ncbi:hypothetical protein [Euzebya tangerina]|uniref:hypothetical protein n=1 Tax=Euzebya tangerina TaxID=591198 RepID=UPI000E320A64|nr:hypothetical protein [Euzebya tangerina]